MVNSIFWEKLTPQLVVREHILPDHKLQRKISNIMINAFKRSDFLGKQWIWGKVKVVEAAKKYFLQLATSLGENES